MVAVWYGWFASEDGDKLIYYFVKDLVKGLCMITSKNLQHSPIRIGLAILVLSTLGGCGPSPEELEAVDYTPLLRDDWPVSTPEEQGLDPMLVARLHHSAAELEAIYSLLVVKDGHLIAEDYFNDGSVTAI